MRSIYISVAITSILILFQSCNKTESENTISTNNVQLEMPEEFLKIGELHNQAVDYVFQSLRDYYKTELKSSNIQVYHMTKQELLDFGQIKVNEFLITEGLIGEKDLCSLNFSAPSLNEENTSEELEFYFSNIRDILAEEPADLTVFATKLNLMNRKAELELSTPQQIQSVYAGTSTTYSSYIYWKANYKKWIIALNYPEVLDQYTDEELNRLEFGEDDFFLPDDNMTKGWFKDKWEDVKTGVKDWWNNGGKDVIETDGAFGAASAITGSIIPGPGTVAGAVGTGGTASIAECIRQLLK